MTPPNTDTIEQLDREEENHILTKNELKSEMVNIEAIKAELDIERSKVRVDRLITELDSSWIRNLTLNPAL